MKKADSDAMRSHYDFAGGVRGKYLPRLAKGANVVVLDRDVAKISRVPRRSTTRCGYWLKRGSGTAKLRLVGELPETFPF